MGEVHVTSLDELVLPSGSYVLVVPGWYPTWIDPYTGDFNQRHVLAVGLRVSQVVLYIGKDPSGTLSSVEVRYNQLRKNVVEILVLYPRKPPAWWDALHSNIIFFDLLNKYSNLIHKKWGRPVLIHSYIVIRGGLAGCWLGKKWKLPLVLTENWTIYHAADPGYLLRRNIIFRLLVKNVFANLDLFLPVTKNLKLQVSRLIKKVDSVVIPNVVDTGKFFYSGEQCANNHFRFVHISTMTYQKNPFGILEAFKAFSQKQGGCVLWMVGPYPKEVLLYANQLGLTNDRVYFKGELTYDDVSVVLKKSDALVLFSRYENLPCVILEALCCGVPVISTNVGGVAEVIDESNGILLESENVGQLEQALQRMYADYASFNRKKIAEKATGLSSYGVVANEVVKSYNRVGVFINY